MQRDAPCSGCFGRHLHLPSPRQLKLGQINVNVVQGYLDAAKAFAEESGTRLEGLDTSEERMHIRTALENGNIEDAISRVNDLNPEVRICPTPRHSWSSDVIPRAFMFKSRCPSTCASSHDKYPGRDMYRQLCLEACPPVPWVRH